MIPVSVLVTTLNEEQNLDRCLGGLKGFNEIIVIDSCSQDRTVEIAKQHGAHIQLFQWNHHYPKKRQWCLDNLKLKNDFIFFVDGDEEVTPELIKEISVLDFSCAGYFVKGRYFWKGRMLNHGLRNNKLALFHRRKVEFPVVDDLDISGMGEMEGHYQPVLKAGYKYERLGQLQNPLNHFSYEDYQNWQKRHERYAIWEAAMISRKNYPADPVAWREKLKRRFRKMPLRSWAAFIHSYIVKAGFLDGIAGWSFAKSRFAYYRDVNRALNANKYGGKNGVENKPRFVTGK